MLKFPMGFLGGEHRKQIRKLHAMTHDFIGNLIAQDLPDELAVLGVEKDADGIGRADHAILE